MKLFFDILSFPAYVALLSSEHVVIAEKQLQIEGRESDLFFGELQKFLAESHVTLSELTGVAVVVGPGGFTTTRLATLIANTLGWAQGTPLFSIAVFDLLQHANTPYPHLARANRNEYLFRSSWSEDPILLRIAQIPDAPLFWVIHPLDFRERQVIIHQIAYRAFFQSSFFQSLTPVPRLFPWYAKAPNIS